MSNRTYFDEEFDNLIINLICITLVSLAVAYSLYVNFWVVYLGQVQRNIRVYLVVCFFCFLEGRMVVMMVVVFEAVVKCSWYIQTTVLTLSRFRNPLHQFVEGLIISFSRCITCVHRQPRQPRRTTPVRAKEQRLLGTRSMRKCRCRQSWTQSVQMILSVRLVNLCLLLIRELS